MDDIEFAVTNFTNIDDSSLFSTCVDKIEEAIVYIPDTILKTLLVDNNEININGDTEIQVSEAENFTGFLDLSYFIDYLDPNFFLFENTITDLTGIEAFKNIVGLDFTDNQYFGTFDFSNNTELTELNLASNSFSEINVSQNTKLTSLDVRSSPLKSLDVTELAELELSLIHI